MGCKCIYICIQGLADLPSCDQTIVINLPYNKLEEILGQELTASCGSYLVELAAKWTCNTITTGAHVLLGKTYQNYMVDVKVRSVSLIRSK